MNGEAGTKYWTCGLEGAWRGAAEQAWIYHWEHLVQESSGQKGGYGYAHPLPGEGAAVPSHASCLG